MISCRFDHLHLRSLDPETAAGFYERHFGARITDRATTNGVLRVSIELSGMAVFIDRVEDGVPTPPPAPFRGLEHLGLAVPDIAAAVAELREAGVAILMEPTEIRPGLVIAFLNGPDDVRVELLQRGSA